MADAARPIDRRWRAMALLLALTAIVGLGLVVALALGWNSRRPNRALDWQASGLPLTLEAGPGSVSARRFPIAPPSERLSIELEARALSDEPFNGYGLILGGATSEQYTLFAVGSDGYYALLAVEGDETSSLVPWQQFPHVRRGQQANRLRAACHERGASFYINDEFAVALEQPVCAGGHVGLWLRGFESPVAVRFNHLHLWHGEHP